MKFFPTIEFVDEMPEEKTVAVMGENYDRNHRRLTGCYTRSNREILILKGRSFKKTSFTVVHELFHWIIDLGFTGQLKEKADIWFDKHFTSKEF